MLICHVNVPLTVHTMGEDFKILYILWNAFYISSSCLDKDKIIYNQIYCYILLNVEQFWVKQTVVETYLTFI